MYTQLMLPLTVKRLGLLLVLLTLGCQRPPMLVPTMFEQGAVDAFYDLDQAERSATVTLFYATDRRSDAGGGNWQSYGRNRSGQLDIGTVQLDFGPGGAAGWPQLATLTSGRPKAQRYNPNPVATYRYGELYLTQHTPDQATGRPARANEPNEASERFIQELASAVDASAGKEITIYIHGFKNGFEEALKTAAEYDLYTADLGPFICYSWPSYNSKWEYSHDRDSVRYTSSHARLLIEFLESQIRSGKLRAERINFIAHSSGAEVVGSVLRELALLSRDASASERRERFRIGAVLLIAPDVSTDVARERLLKEDLEGLYEQIVVYSSTRDRALFWASRFLYRTTRLGSIGETDLTENDRRWLARDPSLQIINVDGQPSHDLFMHSHHRYSPATASDMILCLRSDLTPPERGLVRDDGNLIWRFADDYPSRVTEAAKRVYPLLETDD